MIVKYNLKNMEKCICCICKVQRSKECPKKMTRYVQNLEANKIDTLTLLEPKEFPWLYCNIGKTVCEDLDYTEKCLCNECPLWSEYELDKKNPKEFYCQDGKVKEH